MRDEKDVSIEQGSAETATHSTPHLDLGDRTFAMVLVLMLAGVIARQLLDDEPFRWRKFAAELILTAIFAVALFALGFLQNLTQPQQILMGALSGLGGVRTLEWVVKIIGTIKRT